MIGPGPDHRGRQGRQGRKASPDVHLQGRGQAAAADRFIKHVDAVPASDRRVFVKADADIPFKYVNELFQICRKVAPTRRPSSPARTRARRGRGQVMDAGGPKGKAKSDINVTPLIDIVLVLLIVFIVMVPGLSKALPVVVPQVVKVDKPTPPDPKNPPSSSPSTRTAI